MRLGIGSFAIASSSACCKPAASVTPSRVCSSHTLSTPASSRLDSNDASAPSFSSRFIKAGLGAPLASYATLAGINLFVSMRSAARSSTSDIATPRRRGVAKVVTALALPLVSPASASDSTMRSANAWPKVFNAFGGNSSVSSSTSNVALVRVVATRTKSITRPPATGAPSESPSARVTRNKPRPRRARAFESCRCKPRVR